MTYLTYNIGYLIYKMTYFNKRVSNRVLYINYIALAIVPSWGLPVKPSQGAGSGPAGPAASGPWG